MNIFNYSADTGEFISQSIARENPMEAGEFLIPANATTVSPPITGTNEVAVFAGGSWVLTPDFRGVPYFLIADGSDVTFELGESPDVTVQDTFPQAVQDAIDAEEAAQQVINDERIRVGDITANALARIEAVVPALSTLEMVDLVVEIFKSITPTAKTLTPEFVAANAIRLTAKAAIDDGVTQVADIVWP